MLDFNKKEQCYSCSACYSICPKSAIKMIQNDEGFLNPKVEEENCIKCGLCEKVCPVLDDSKLKKQNDNQKIFSLIRKDYSDKTNYTSAGVFYSLTKAFINEGGYVVGCIWDDNMVAKHVVTNKIEIAKKMSGSKYVQSDLNDVFKQIKLLLKSNKKVLFSGTACQIDGLKKYIGNDNLNLFLFEIICHGCPSPKVLKLYFDDIQQKYKSKVVSANFRYKGKYGWITPMSYIKLENGKTLEQLAFTDNSYVVGFANDLFHKNSCYSCKYKGNEFVGDITVGDFWGCKTIDLNQSKNNGISELICNNGKGEYLLSLIIDKFFVKYYLLSDAKKENLAIYCAPNRNSNRKKYFELINHKEKYSKKYIFNYKIRVKSLLNKFGIFQKIKLKKYRSNH